MRSEVKRLRSTLVKRVIDDQSWLYSRSETGIWVRTTLDLIAGEIRLEYQPKVVFDRDTVSLYDLDGRLEARYIRGVSVSDMPQDEWRLAARLNVDLIDGLHLLNARDHLKALKRIRDNILMLTLLGYGDSAQEVASWFERPSECAWIKPGMPVVVQARDIGFGSLEATNVIGSICGSVSFTVEMIGDEVDFSLSWDKFLLSSTIDARERFDEIY
jgi:hypothetical protein